MRWKAKFALGVAAALSSAATIRAQGTSTIVYPANNQMVVVQEDAQPSLSSKLQTILGLQVAQAPKTEVAPGTPAPACTPGPAC